MHHWDLLTGPGIVVVPPGLQAGVRMLTGVHMTTPFANTNAIIIMVFLTRVGLPYPTPTHIRTAVVTIRPLVVPITIYHVGPVVSGILVL